jgi:uncharacterized repeat protein (TIGR03803 family)
MKTPQTTFTAGFCILKTALFPILLMLGLGCAWHAGAQGWVTNSPLLVPRWWHTATPLTNGTVLIAGGAIYNMNGNEEDTNECEIYDPAIGSPSFTGFMNRARHSHVATLLTNGQVLVSGGGGDSSSETYDPGSGTWINWVSMNEERLVHIAVLMTNGQVLAAGGYDDNGGGDTASAEIYDPGSQTWTLTAPMPYAADTLAAVLLTNGTILVCGGSYNSSGVTNAAIYHPSSQTWSNTAGMNEARTGHAATLLTNGRVLVEGGAGDQSAEIYDPVAQTWTLVGSMNDGRYACDAVRLTNGEVLVTGDGNPDVELYDPIQDVWNYTNSLPVPGNYQTETLMANGQVLVTGGGQSQFNGPPIGVIETFSTLPVLPAISMVVTDAPTTGRLPLAVQFTSPATDSLGNDVTNWNWSFGDGGTSTNRSPLHTYTVAGTYSPGLLVMDSGTGKPVTVSGLQPVTVTNDALTVTVIPAAGAVPLTVQFTSPATDSLGSTVTNWSWSFGDGFNSTLRSPSHIYTTVGTFSPSLVALSTYSTNPLAVFGLSSVTTSNAPNPSFHVIYSMPPNSGPNGGLVLAGNTLYGTTISAGSVFAVSTSGSGYTNLYTGLGGPRGGLVLAGAMLYGTTSVGGTNGGGIVFGINTNSTGFTNLYNFPLGGASTGQEPEAGLSYFNGILYGTTQYGGGYSDGAVFSISTNGTGIADVHSFGIVFTDYRINSDGDGPFARVIFGNGFLYGTTEAGGNNGDGVVFSVATNQPGTFTVLHYFNSTLSNGTNSDGAFPFSGLLQIGNMLYGTAAFGGVYGNGSVYAVSTNGLVFTNLYSFTGGNDGSVPECDLTISGNTLYGTTTAGGTASNGVLFAINTDGTGFKTLYSFTGGNDGATPKGGLTLGGNVLYGATTAGGAGANAGAIFSYTLTSPVLLSIARSGTNVILTWSPDASGYTLESSTQLGAGAAWNTVSPSPMVVNSLETVTNGISGPTRFYRLTQ